MKSNSCTTAILILLIALNLVFIWGNSILSRTESGQVSSEVTEVMRPILEPIIGDKLYTGGFVRKLAHFVEFGVLGGLLSLLMNTLNSKYSLRRTSILPYMLMSGLVAAMIDETIQIFTKRGSQVSDVWLDYSGVLTGFILIHLVYICATRIYRKKFMKQN